jgi:hypothetical protein
MIAALAPIRERAEGLRSRPATVLDLLREGARKAMARAAATMSEVRRRMGLLGQAEV